MRRLIPVHQNSNGIAPGNRDDARRGEPRVRPVDSPYAYEGEHEVRPYEKHRSLSGAKSLIPLLLVMALIATGCSSQVVGMQSPAAHDYDVVDWLPLQEPIRQPFVVSSGYSAAIAGDPETTPARLLARLDRLPEDAQEGSLTRVRVGVRPMDEPVPEDTGATVQVAYAPELDPRFPEQSYRDWPQEHGWLPELNRQTAYEQSFTSPYPNLDGLLVRTATFQGDLTPGTAVIGSNGAPVMAAPTGGEVIARLSPRQEVRVTGAIEGRATTTLPDGTTGYVELDKFSTLPPPARRISQSLTVEILSAESGEIVRTVDVPPSEIHDNAHLAIRFDPIEPSSSRRYLVRFTMTADPGSGITLRRTGADSYSEGQLRVAGDVVDSDLVFRPLYASSQMTFEAEVRDLPRDGQWAIIEDPPELRPGTVAAMTLLPGTRADEPAWEFGTTRWRSPYGGWPAGLLDASSESPSVPGSAARQPLEQRGAVLFQTTYQRDINAAAILDSAAEQLRGLGQQDPIFALGFATTLIAISALALLAWRRSGKETSHHGH